MGKNKARIFVLAVCHVCPTSTCHDSRMLIQDEDHDFCILHTLYLRWLAASFSGSSMHDLAASRDL